MRVLVTGAETLIGRHVVDHLVARGDFVRVFARPESLEGLHHLRNLDDLDCVGGDATKGHLEDGLDGIDVVCHLSQLSPSRERAPQSVIAANVEQTDSLLRACRGSVERFVFMSTVSVYRPARNLSMWPISEKRPLQAHGDYDLHLFGQTKIDAENLVRRYGHNRGLEYVILRPSVVYGPQAVFAESLLQEILHAPRRALARTSRLGTMQWVHRCDFADAVVEATTRAEASDETLNIAGKEPFTVPDLMTLVWRLRTGREAVLEWLQQQRDRSLLRFDISRARAFLGFSPDISLQTGIQEMLVASTGTDHRADCMRMGANAYAW